MSDRGRGEIDRMIAALRAAASYEPDLSRPPVVLALPFRGTWTARNSPARRVPSHGTHFFGQTFAIDLVAADRRGRTAAVRDWRTLVATEPAERYYGFGAPILAPAAGRVVAVHDGEPDHPGRRSLLTLILYLLTQRSRLRRGVGGVAGNHIILALGDGGPYVFLAHLRAGSIEIRAGDTVAAGQPIAACGNSGNSTQPHIHLQVMDGTDPLTARGLPMAFRDYRVWTPGQEEPRDVPQGLPNDGEIIEPTAQDNQS